MVELAKRIGLDSALVEKLGKLLDEKGDKVESLAEKCLDRGFHILKKRDSLFRLAVILCLAVRVKGKYDNAGIDEKIYYDTMGDIKIWCEKNGNRGLKNCGWLKNHVCFELFRLGRLQFQLYECKNKTLLYKKLPFDYSERLVYVHIPEGEKLEKSRCIESLKCADEFFKQYFPNYSYKYYFCESWLLYAGNRAFMAENSNIVSFMSLFDICYSVKIDEQAIERIYGKRRLFKRLYPGNTDLQKRARKYMLNGNRMGIGIGVIKRTGEYE